MAEVVDCQRCHTTVAVFRTVKSNDGRRVCYPCLADIAGLQCERCKTLIAADDATTTDDGRRVCFNCLVDLLQIETKTADGTFKDAPRLRVPEEVLAGLEAARTSTSRDRLNSSVGRITAGVLFILGLGLLAWRFSATPVVAPGDDRPLRVVVEPDGEWVFIRNQETASISDVVLTVNERFESPPAALVGAGAECSIRLDHCADGRGAVFDPNAAQIATLRVMATVNGQRYRYGQ